MTVTYTWTFPTLETKPSADGLQNVVAVVHWRLAASDGEHAAEVYGTVALDEPAAADFVAFDALTPAIVEAWVSAKLDLDERKASLAAQLAAMAAPAVVAKAPPWAA